jgi:hypothetical protein
VGIQTSKPMTESGTGESFRRRGRKDHQRLRGSTTNRDDVENTIPIEIAYRYPLACRVASEALTLGHAIPFVLELSGTVCRTAFALEVSRKDTLPVSGTVLPHSVTVEDSEYVPQAPVLPIAVVLAICPIAPVTVSDDAFEVLPTNVLVPRNTAL